MSPLQDSSSNNYALILENIDDAVIAVNQQGEITLFNPAAQNFTGLSEKQGLGKSFFECFAWQQTLCDLARIALDEGRSISDHETITLKSTSRRRLRLISAAVSPILSQEGQQGAIVVLRDLTQIRSLESVARHAERLSMVETMAAGLAHEIKNPLGGIRGAAQLLQMELDDNPELQEYTDLIIRESERVNRIIEELLNLSAARQTRSEPVNINKLLDEIVTLHKHAVATRGIRFKLLLDPSIPPLPGDSDLLTQLFLNLLKNAWEATVDNSEITIETRIDADYYLGFQGYRPTQLVQIRISDRGLGMSQTELDQVFTPFYTTKSGGSGLGLPICQKIITDHGGFLHFNDFPEGGTTATVSLPLLRSHRLPDIKDRVE